MPVIDEIKGRFTTATTHKIKVELTRRLGMPVAVEINDRGNDYQIKVGLGNISASSVNEVFLTKETAFDFDGDLTNLICNLLMERFGNRTNKKINEHAPLGGW